MRHKTINTRREDNILPGWPMIRQPTGGTRRGGGDGGEGKREDNTWFSVGVGGSRQKQKKSWQRDGRERRQEMWLSRSKEREKRSRRRGVGVGREDERRGSEEKSGESMWCGGGGREKSSRRCGGREDQKKGGLGKTDESDEKRPGLHKTVIYLWMSSSSLNLDTKEHQQPTPQRRPLSPVSKTNNTTQTYHL
ncbi:hypothetical protein Pmani_010513 [Petrolisthes manimaculis]|uniref:Uncharacterized protein n=1 Tax=Petrolisthes manimaculis TaxID=1843537 RepID=A0AAE1Q2Z0_9EUCA|nr:hypothetical protein Pmani_010513 [Petrolisthes manimaculis]